MKPVGHTRLLYAEFDCERIKDQYFYPILTGLEVPAGEIVNIDDLYYQIINKIYQHMKIRAFQTRKAILFNRRFIIKVQLDDEIIFSTEAFLFDKVRDKLKFNLSEGSIERFRHLLKYMIGIQFNPVSFNDEFIKLEDPYGTELSTQQKLILLDGMASAKPRDLVSIYNNKGIWNLDETKDVNTFVSLAIKKYGKELLLKLFTLNKLPSHINNVTRAYSFFDNKRLNSIRVSLDKDREFVIEQTERDGAISMRKDGKKLHEIKKDGSLKSYMRTEKFDPTLTLFIAFLNDPLNQIIYFGAETKRCSFCNLPLEDPKSLTVGYGKKCAVVNNLDWG